MAVYECMQPCGCVFVLKTGCLRTTTINKIYCNRHKLIKKYQVAPEPYRGSLSAPSIMQTI